MRRLALRRSLALPDMPQRFPATSAADLLHKHASSRLVPSRGYLFPGTPPDQHAKPCSWARTIRFHRTLQRPVTSGPNGHFCNNYWYFLVLSWLPLHLVKQQGFSLTTMAWLGGAVYLISSTTGLIGARGRWLIWRGQRAGLLQHLLDRPDPLG